MGGVQFMILDSLEFKAMESGIKAMSIKQQVHTHNIANIDTPDYKLKTFSFKNALEDAFNNNGEYQFEATVTERDNTEVLIDGNNVDVEAENLELYSAYIQSAATIQKMNSVINDLRYVLTNANFK